MPLFAIGDLHLPFGASKPMDIFGGGWDGYVDKLREGFKAVSDGDTVVLCGDITWGMTIEEAEPDFRFIDGLPGRKIFLKGNHDYWFTTAAKAKTFFEKNGLRGVEILNNNCYAYGGAAICGTRGWMLEDGAEGEPPGGKIMAREVMRLEASLKAAGEREKLCFFHYPPRFRTYVCEDIIDVMKKYGARRCWYGHIHGRGHKYAVTGWVDGIEYNMVSADHLNFVPRLVAV